MVEFDIWLLFSKLSKNDINTCKSVECLTTLIGFSNFKLLPKFPMEMSSGNKFRVSVIRVEAFPKHKN